MRAHRHLVFHSLFLFASSCRRAFMRRVEWSTFSSHTSALGCHQNSKSKDQMRRSYPGEMVRDGRQTTTTTSVQYAPAFGGNDKPPAPGACWKQMQPYSQCQDGDGVFTWHPHARVQRCVVGRKSLLFLHEEWVSPKGKRGTAAGSSEGMPAHNRNYYYLFNSICLL